MRLRYSFEIVRIDDKSIAVPVGDGAEQFGGILECNETAAAILELLKTETTEAEIIEALKREYEAAEGEIEREVHSCLRRLQSSSWLEQEPAGDAV